MLDDNLFAIGPEVAEAAAVAIFAHSRGGSPSEMRDLAIALATPAIRFIMPEAPGRTWYPERFLAPIARNEPALSRSLDAYARIVNDLIADGVLAENIILGGFSQGACLAAEMLIRHPRRYGAALILTGGLIGPPGTDWPLQPALEGVHVYLTGSEIDEWVPASRVEETERIFSASGAKVTLRIFEKRPHQVCAEEIASARAMLAQWQPNETGRSRATR